MKVLVDTNVILDVLLNRPAFYADSRVVFELSEHKRITGHVCASAITDIFYFLNKEIKDLEAVYQAVEMLVALFTVVQVSESVITSALSLRWKDFEDAVQFTAARENNLECIITRNKSDYKTSNIPCLTPAEFITNFK